MERAFLNSIYLKGNMRKIFQQTIFLMTIFVIFSINLHSQNQDSIKFTNSESLLSLGMILGSAIQQEEHFKPTIGVLVEYKLNNSNASIQFLSESNRLNNLLSNTADKNINIHMIGIKAYLKSLKNLYILPAIGLQIAEASYFNIALNVGYDVYITDLSKTFLQVLFNSSDRIDTFVSLRAGIIFKL